MKTANKLKAEKAPPKSKAVKGTRRSARKSAPAKSNGKHPPTTYEHAPIGIVEASLEGLHINVNEEFCRIVGYEKEELVGRPIKEFTHEEDYPIDVKLHEQLVAGKIPFYRFEKRHLSKDGSEIWVELTRSIVRDEQGNPLYTIGVVLDISERKHVERVLRESVERLRLATEAAQMFTWEWDFQNQSYTLSDSFTQVLGFQTDLLSKNPFETIGRFVPAEDLQSVSDAFQKVVESRKDLHSLPCRVIDPKTGQIVWLEISAKIVYDHTGNPQRMFGVAQNITEGKKAQDEIAIISRMPAENPNPVMRLTPDGKVLYANTASLVMLESWRLQNNQTVPADLQWHVAEAFASGLKKELEIQQNGNTLACTLAPIREAGYVNFYGNDITARKRAEENLRASEALYRTIARSLPGGGVYVVDKDFRYLVAEGPVTEAFGLSREMLEGHTVSEVFPDERGTRMEDRLRQNFAGETVGFETEFNGRVYWTQQAPLLDSIGQAVILTLDITERKQAEEALRQSEERFARFMQQLPGLAWIKDMQGRYVYANAAAEKAFNTPREELYGKTDEEIFPRKAAAQFKENDQQALMEGQGVQVIETLEQADGVLHFSLVSKFPIPGPDGNPAWIGGTAFDITERLQAEEALRESEERFSAILRQATAGIVRKDADGRLIFVNQAFCNMLGYTEEELLGKTIWDVMHPEDIAENKGSYDRLMAEGIPFNLERRLLREDGSVIWVDASVSPIMDATGKPQSAVAVEVDLTGRKQAEEALRELNLQLEDRVLSRTAKLRAVNQTLREEITERKRVEEALRQSEATARTNEEKLRTLFDLLPVGISFLDPKGQIVQMNSALMNILKLSREQLLSQAYQSRRYIRADGMPMSAAEFASTRALTEEQTIYNVETGILLENSEVVWTNVSAAPVDVADVGAVVVTVDITDSKRAERALQESHRRLRILSQRLVEVQEDERRALARELHDRVGQTLAALNINLIIISSQLSGEAAEQIGTRLNDSMKLVAETIALVRDVMTDLRPSVLDDYGLEAALESHLAQFISRYDISAKLEKPDQPLPRLGPSIEMTFLRIAQEALMNIARHAEATQIRLSLRREADMVCLTIEDNGIGIESWQEATRPGSHGLTIMRERAEAFDGYLKVSSVPGQGTVVDVTIPLTSNGQNESREKKDL